MSIYEQYVELHREKRDATDALDAVKKKINEMEEILLEKFIEDGLNNVNVGGPTLWLDRKIWASAGGDVDGAVTALEAAGEYGMVKKTINRNTLSAWVREQAGPLDTPEEIQANLPAGLGAAIKVTETQNIRVRGL